MTRLLHSVFTPKPPPAPTIYEEIIDLVEQAEQADDEGHAVEALILLTTARTRLATYLSGSAN